MAKLGIKWDDVGSVRAAIAGDLTREMAKSLDPKEAAVRNTVAELTPEELARMAATTSMACYRLADVAQAFKREKDFPRALKIYDALATARRDFIRPGAAVNATYCVLAGSSGLGVQRERGLHYAACFAPLGYTQPSIYLNLAFLYVELEQHEGAVAMLRQAILAGHPDVQTKWLADADFAPLRSASRNSTAELTLANCAPGRIRSRHAVHQEVLRFLRRGSLALARRCAHGRHRRVQQ